ncbi:hypothetical protein QP968_00575 [Corynebacterium sp. MSK041]|uniref:hypothetical protein n=1 Tax=Corynebacterium sp. MSK041 TaxID=3050194 RepID=UPI00254A5E40|nr:hypothetical protein [Corynebacterium sp. MSK041]MDK8794207.1 hypothetical protein [Corynebacterium sp. MSK041]
MTDDFYICEILVTRTWRDTLESEWLPAENTDWGTRDQAINTAAEWEAEGYTARIKKRPT